MSSQQLHRGLRWPAQALTLKPRHRIQHAGRRLHWRRHHHLGRGVQAVGAAGQGQACSGPCSPQRPLRGQLRGPRLLRGEAFGGTSSPRHAPHPRFPALRRCELLGRAGLGGIVDLAWGILWGLSPPGDHAMPLRGGVQTAREECACSSGTSGSEHPQCRAGR